jgi:hypothetical protein
MTLCHLSPLAAGVSSASKRSRNRRSFRAGFHSDRLTACVTRVKRNPISVALRLGRDRLQKQLGMANFNRTQIGFFKLDA